MALPLPLRRPLAPSLVGPLYMVAAAFFFATMNACVRWAAEAGHDPLQIAFFRNAFALAFMIPWLLRTRLAGLRTRRLGAHVWRASIGLASMTLWFFSVALLPLAEAVSLNFTFPLFATVAAVVFLKEEVRARRWTATAVGFLGALIVLRPGAEAFRPEALLPVGAALLMACSATLVKSLSRTEAPGTVVFYMNAVMTPLSLIPALFVWTWPTGGTWLALLILGFFAAVSHICLTRAYTLADASAVQAYDYLRLPFAALLGYLLFGEVPSLWLLPGAALIVGAAAYIARREASLARQQRRVAAARPDGAGT